MLQRRDYDQRLIKNWTINSAVSSQRERNQDGSVRVKSKRNEVLLYTLGHRQTLNSKSKEAPEPLDIGGCSTIQKSRSTRTCLLNRKNIGAMVALSYF